MVLLDGGVCDELKGGGGLESEEESCGCMCIGVGEHAQSNKQNTLVHLSLSHSLGSLLLKFTMVPTL